MSSHKLTQLVGFQTMQTFQQNMVIYRYYTFGIYVERYSVWAVWFHLLICNAAYGVYISHI